MREMLACGVRFSVHMATKPDGTSGQYIANESNNSAWLPSLEDGKEPYSDKLALAGSTSLINSVSLWVPREVNKSTTQCPQGGPAAVHALRSPCFRGLFSRMASANSHSGREGPLERYSD